MDVGIPVWVEIIVVTLDDAVTTPVADGSWV